MNFTVEEEVKHIVKAYDLCFGEEECLDNYWAVLAYCAHLETSPIIKQQLLDEEAFVKKHYKEVQNGLYQYWLEHKEEIILAHNKRWGKF